MVEFILTTAAIVIVAVWAVKDAKENIRKKEVKKQLTALQKEFDDFVIGTKRSGVWHLKKKDERRMAVSEKYWRYKDELALLRKESLDKPWTKWGEYSRLDDPSGVDKNEIATYRDVRRAAKRFKA